MLKMSYRSEIKWFTVAAIAGGVILLAALPLWASGNIYIYSISVTGVFIILGLCIRLLLLSGLLNFSLLAFMAIGAYASVLLMSRLNFSFWLSLVGAGAIAILIALVIGTPVLRCKGAYFFLLTIALQEITVRVIGHWVGLTGGYGGLVVPKGAWLETEVTRYYLILFGTLVSLFIFYRLEGGQFGRILLSIGASEDLAKVVGINVAKYKLIAFTIGSLFAAIGGVLYAQVLEYIAPVNFGMFVMIYLILYVVIGGYNYFAGPLVGVAIMRLISTSLMRGSRYEPLFMGLLMIIVLKFLPGGIMGFLHNSFQKFMGTSGKFRSLA